VESESVEARARLRSVTAGRLRLPTTDTVAIGRRGFYYTDPATWKLELSVTSYDRHVNVAV